MEIEATFRVEQSKVFDEKGNVKQDILDKMVANVVEECAKTIESGVREKVKGLKTQGTGLFLDTTRAEKKNDKHWIVTEHTTPTSVNESYATVIEYGYRGKKQRYVPFLWKGQETELVKYLLRNGWKRTEKRGELISPQGNKYKGITVKHEGKFPFRRGFYATKDKWVYSALKGIEKALNY
jgi:hypothetical protein